MKPYFVRWAILWVGLLVSTFFTSFSHAAQPVKIGVLAFRPKPQMLAQWQPLAKALKQAVPDHDFILEIYSFPELNDAVIHRQIDFVLTNPGHYVVLTRRHGLSSPLATLATEENGQRATEFGGVIFSRADRADIHALKDIHGKTIAAIGTESLGGFQMQAFELKTQGMSLPPDNKMLITGAPHDNVVDAVLTGRADIGFVRTGVLEDLARQGKLDLKDIRVLNDLSVPGISRLVSTRLYPEWPFAALPQVDENLARKVASALLGLAENTEVARAIGIHGFVVPIDYTPVADLLRELRLPPYEAMPSFTLADVVQRYRWQVVSAALAIGLIVLLGFRLLLAKRKLLALAHYSRSLFEASLDPLVTIDAQGKITDVNTATERIKGMDRKDLIGSDFANYFTEPEQARKSYQQAFEKGRVIDYPLAVRHTSGQILDVLYNASVYRDEAGKVAGVVATARDVTERKQAEELVRQLAYYDSLTGLANRMLLGDRLTQAMLSGKRKSEFSALLFMDLDNFKPVNDRYGHGAGDLLLIEVAKRLKQCVREVDTVARFGGDEFVVLLNALAPDRAQAHRQVELLAKKICAALSVPYVLHLSADSARPPQTIEHRCTASIGVMLFHGMEITSEELIKRADLAMYQAKEEGRNLVRFYD